MLFTCYSQNIPILPVFATHLAPKALSVGPEQLGVFLGLQAAVLGSGGLCQGGAPWLLKLFGNLVNKGLPLVNIQKAIENGH
jgi:hypothetical protein